MIRAGPSNWLSANLATSATSALIPPAPGRDLHLETLGLERHALHDAGPGLVTVRRGVILGGRGGIEVERRARHADRIEHALLHRARVGLAQRRVVVGGAGQDGSRVATGGERVIAVPVQLTGRRHGRDLGQRRDHLRRRETLEEQQRVVLGHPARQADQMAQPDLLRPFGIGEREARDDLVDRLVPVQEPVVRERRHHRGGHRLGERSEREQRRRRHWSAVVLVAYSEARLIRDLPSLITAIATPGTS